MLTAVCYRQHVKHVLIALLLFVLAACPRQTRKTLVPDVPKHGDATARSRFLEAKSRFLRDGMQAKEFKQIAEDFPNDPIVPWAELYAGIALVKSRNFTDADKQLSSVIESDADPGLTARAELFLDADEALADALRPHLDAIAGEVLARRVHPGARAPRPDIEKQLDLDGASALVGLMRFDSDTTPTPNAADGA